jgi:hypothetical protein
LHTMIIPQRRSSPSNDLTSYEKPNIAVYTAKYSSLLVASMALARTLISGARIEIETGWRSIAVPHFGCGRKGLARCLKDSSRRCGY